ncbi:hypothetical protein Tco_0797269 [Tanacetum coccineum]
MHKFTTKEYFDSEDSVNREDSRHVTSDIREYDTFILCLVLNRSTTVKAKDSEVCKIIRADGTSSLDLDLWGDLKMMFDPNEEDDIWLNQHYWELLRWKLYEYNGVHSLFLDGTSIQINMLVEKKYPLKKEILEKMINLKIEAEEERKEAKVFERILSKSKSFNSRNLRFEDVFTRAHFPLPAISPFLCTDSSEAPDSSDGPPSQDPYVMVVARWRSKVASRPSSSSDFPLCPLLNAPPGTHRSSRRFLLRPGERLITFCPPTTQTTSTGDSSERPHCIHLHILWSLISKRCNLRLSLYSSSTPVMGSLASYLADLFQPLKRVKIPYRLRLA